VKDSVVRITARLKGRLQEAAEHNKQSLTREIEQRLMMSFAVDILNQWKPAYLDLVGE
jgi:hypothetical protein